MTPPDYRSLIDAPTWAFIAQSAVGYPADATGLSIADQRALYDAMCRRFHRGHPPHVRARTHEIAGVPVRSYAGSSATVVYFHGGGFVVGGLESHDDICAEICAATGYAVVAVDYRLVPEHPHPAAFNDSLAVTRAVAAEAGSPLVLAGDSAGGSLAAAVAQAAGRRGALGIAGQVLMYPGLGGDPNRGSYLTHAHAPMLSRADVLWYAALRMGDAAPHDPTLSPLADSDFAGLPPTITFAAECDPLADDARDYAAALSAAGCTAVCVEEPGLVHGYLRARATVARAAASFARITDAIGALGQGMHPTAPR